MTPTTVPVLVPDLDGDLTRTMQALSGWAGLLVREQVDDLLGMEAAELVAPLDRLFELVASLEINESVEQAAAEDGNLRLYADRVFGPDGRYEYTPLHPVHLDSADIEVLHRGSGLISHIQEDPHSELASVLEDLAPLYGFELGLSGTQIHEVGYLEPLRALDRVLAVLGLTGHDPDRERLHDILLALPATERPERTYQVDRILSDEAETLFREVSAQIVRTWYPPAEQDLQTWARL